MTYFFFGTLMDRDMLAAVLDRRLAEDEMVPAWLHDHRRVRAAMACYPVLVRSPGLVVGGVVFEPKDERDEVRIRHFEEDEYAARWLPVRLAGARTIAARVFFGLELMPPSEEPWDLAAWAGAHKARFLEQCRAWMRDCPAPAGAAAPVPRASGRRS